jgi:tetratricopeptide (TPR) repeat protein/tRNA A-37 threonylcarbamoyl transferase component Bud32
MTDLEREQHLDAVLTAYLKAVDDGQEPDRAALLINHPDLAAELHEFFDEQDRLTRWTEPLRPTAQAACVAALDTNDLFNTPQEAVAQVSGGSLPSFGDYELFQEIGRGGMGIVYKARQRSLNRLVALKMIRPGDAAADIQRFRNEAETIALLDHPHIVPVYEVGEQEGQLYFSMKLIEGGSLADRLGEFMSAPRTAAELMVKVARAVHHAHQRGILHRDLKPSNVLLDGSAQPYVTDFGLAKRVESQANLTDSGALVGTPSYMSPEQAAGKKVPLTTATDVYGLGTILYTLLTGVPPFQAETRLDTLLLVREHEPELLRQKNRRVDKDLETVCLHCLQKDPRRRYASAESLANDLSQWLSGEPILARPITPIARVWRWCRRNHAIAGLAVALAMVVIVGFAGLLLSYQKLRQEQTRTQLALQAEERRQTQALQIVDDMYTEVAAKWLEQQPQLDETQREFLLKALSFYEAFAREKNSDPTRSLDTARACRRAGAIRAKLGQHAEAESLLQRALELNEALVESFRGVPIYQKELAESYMAMGTLYGITRREREAEQAQLKALPLLEALSKSFPKEPEYQLDLARNYHWLGHLRSVTGRVTEAEQAYRKGLGLSSRLAQEYPDVASYSLEFAYGCHGLGRLLKDAIRIPEAEKAVRQALEVHTRLAQNPLCSQDNQWATGLCCNSLGVLLLEAGRLPQAEEALRQAQESFERLVKDHPKVPDYRSYLAMTYSNMAGLFEKTNRIQDAERFYGMSLSLEGALAREFPAMPDYRHELASMTSNLCRLLVQSGRGDKAESHYREAMKLYEGLMQDLPDVVEYQLGMASVSHSLGVLLRKLGNGRNSEQCYRRSLEIYAFLSPKLLTEPNYQRAVARSSSNLGNLLNDANRLDEAEPFLRQSVQFLENLASRSPARPDDHNELGGALNNLANLQMKRPACRAEARLLLERAIRQQKTALQANPQDPRYLSMLNNHLGNLTTFLLQLGLYRDAAESAVEFTRIARENPRQYAYAWSFLMQCAPLAEQDAKLPAAQRKIVAGDYRQHARELIDQAVQRAPADAAFHNELAWNMAASPVMALCDPTKAVELAGKAVKQRSGTGAFWNTLGVAYYRTGNWQAAIKALNQSVELRQGGDTTDWFFLAMAYWQLGDKQQARKWYDQAKQWMAKKQPNNEELLRFRAEADELFAGTQAKSAPKQGKEHAR